MRDIATLKDRVDYAERHLQATETARNRESEALMDTWRKIRERFTLQEGEIARYRSEVESLTESNEKLSHMVDDLIAIIDGNVERSRDETIPKITTLAEDLLASEPSSEDFSRFADDAVEKPSAADEPEADLSIPEHDIDLEIEPSEPETLELDEVVSDVVEDEDPPGETLSPGIRSLIERVEGSVEEPGGLSSGASDGDDEDDDLARELKEIEMLRSELSGLRDRISAEDA
jgi:hypothetical protein